MNTGQYVFSQVTSFLSTYEFNRHVEQFSGNHKVKHFTCWNQLMCMLFGQFTNRDSLSDLVVCLSTQHKKWYHLGMGASISKSNLAYANEHRDWRIFAGFAYWLMAEARRICTDTADFELNIEGQVYAVDASTIDLCLSVFWWAKFRKNKAAVKLHTQLDIKTEIPSFIHLTDGKVHDVKFLDLITYETGAFYIMDRGYIDFARLYVIDQANGWFVTRAKTNMNFRRLYSKKVNKSTGVICDQTIRLNNFYAQKDYPKKMRRIKYYDAESSKTLVFITNNFSLEPEQIALLYKYRWKIELFFKWIKQHLKVKTFWGYSQNAVRIQIYTAIIAYTLVAIIRQKLKIRHSCYEILQILSITILNKTHLQQLFEVANQQKSKEHRPEQPSLFDLH